MAIGASAPKRESLFTRILSRPRGKHAHSRASPHIDATPTTVTVTNPPPAQPAKEPTAPSPSRLGGLRRSFSLLPRSRSVEKLDTRTPETESQPQSAPPLRAMRRSSSLERVGSRVAASVGSIVRTARRSKDTPQSPDTVITGANADADADMLPASCLSATASGTAPILALSESTSPKAQRRAKAQAPSAAEVANAARSLMTSAMDSALESPTGRDISPHSQSPPRSRQTTSLGGSPTRSASKLKDFVALFEGSGDVSM